MKHPHVSATIFSAIIHALGRRRAKMLLDQARAGMGRRPYADRTITRFMAGYSHPLPEVVAECVHRIMRTRGVKA